MDTIASAKPIPAPATAPVAKPGPAKAPAISTATAAGTAPVARPRLLSAPMLRIMDYFVIALTVVAACSLLAAAQSHGDSHSRELLPTLVMTSGR